LTNGAKLPLQIAGPFFSSLASSAVDYGKFWIMVALGVGFTGCATLFARKSIDHENICVFHRAKGKYAEYVRDFCKTQNVAIQPNPSSRELFWERIGNMIEARSEEYGSKHINVIYCGSTLGVNSLHQILEGLREKNSRYAKVSLFAESFG